MLEIYGEQMASGMRMRREAERTVRVGIEPASPCSSAPPTQASEEAAMPTADDDRRNQLVERVAREIIDNLLVIGAQTPVVQEIADELESTFDSRFLFEYGFMECDLQVFRHTTSGTEKLEGDEAREVLDALWRITVSKVDKTML